MRRFVSTIDLPKEEWLKYRKMGITGTDAGAITGMNPYVSAFSVYQDKVTDIMEQNDNEAMRQGRDMEEYVAKRFEMETGFKVRRANAIYQNEEHPFMLADFDRILVGQKAGLECKTVSPYSADKWEDNKIPLHYQMQVQHYLAVSGFDCWYIAALIWGRDFMIRKIERDEELIQLLITVEERFWNENVMKHVIPEPDGTKDCSEQIQKQYFKSDEKKSVQLIGYNDMLHRHSELDSLIKKMEVEKAKIEQRIKLEMQDASCATAEGYRVSWASFNQVRFDSKKLKAEQPEIYEKYAKVSSGRRFIIKHAA